MSHLMLMLKRCSVALAALLACSATAAAANEVKLLKFNSVRYPTCLSNAGQCHLGLFEVVVASMAGAKKVQIHYRRSDNTWANAGLTFNRLASSGKEVWAANFINWLDGSNAHPAGTIVLAKPSSPLEFAVRYEVGGNVYWDNNASQNYRLKLHGGTFLVGANVYDAMHAKALPDWGTTSFVDSYVTLRNLALNKTVQVHYTVNDWATVKVANATYDADFWKKRKAAALANPNSYGFEEWKYRLNLGTTSTHLQYAIKYTVNGVSYWDNNFGRNYSVTIDR